MYRIAEKLGTDSAFFFYRGRVALYAMLKAMCVGPGDEVLLQAFTCLAVPNPIVSIGATPVYVDITQKTFNMDPGLIETKISDATKVIIVQHTFGIPADMSSILAIANKYNLYVIEDCCHAFGSTYDDKEVGSFGDGAFHSYEWGKPVIIGLGGTATINNPALQWRMTKGYAEFVDPPRSELVMVNLQYIAYTLLFNPSLFWFMRDMYRLLSKAGVLVGTFRKEELAGQISRDYNRKMFEICKNRLFRKLSKLEDSVAHSTWVASIYRERLINYGYEPVEKDDKGKPVFLRYPLLVKEKIAVLEEAHRRKIELSDIFNSPIHPLKEADWKHAGYEAGMCPVAEEISRQVVSLPINPKVNESQIERSMRFLADVRSYARMDSYSTTTAI